MAQLAALRPHGCWRLPCAGVCVGDRLAQFPRGVLEVGLENLPVSPAPSGRPKSTCPPAYTLLVLVGDVILSSQQPGGLCPAGYLTVAFPVFTVSGGSYSTIHRGRSGAVSLSFTLPQSGSGPLALTTRLLSVVRCSLRTNPWCLLASGLS
ncbi:hypothetical protein BD413DRAFT_96279 [Trametes elegans]|nr:hypothetical protein BD413DRAFT_96279 [Trametes elegans]